MTTDDELRNLIALGEKATARPWVAEWEWEQCYFDFDFRYIAWAETPTITGPELSSVAPQAKADQLYMETAANLAPAIAAELIEARAALAKANEALKAAVAAIYFDDNSDYLPALWSIVKRLGGEELASQLETDERAVFNQVCGEGGDA